MNMSGEVLLSVVVITKNEEKNIGECLASVSNWANEIMVVDDFSSDRTVEIARGYTDRIFQKKMEVEGVHRNWAYQQAKNEWVLSLDADERVTPDLRSEIAKVLNSHSEYSAFSIPLRNYIGDYWVRYGGWYPAPKLRLFKKDMFKYEEVGIHPRVILKGKCGRLNCDIIHKGHLDFSHYIDKLNSQTTLEAKKWVDTGRKMSFLHALRRTIDRFFRTYIRKKGYEDGFVGFMVAIFNSLYQILSYAKYLEMKKKI